MELFERGIWAESLRNFWANKYVVLTVVGIIVAVSVFQALTHSTGSAGMWSEFAWVPVAVAAHSTILNGTSGFSAMGRGGYKPIWSPFFWRSVGLSLIGTIPAIAVTIPFINKGNETRFVVVFLCVYAIFESLILAKWGTMLPACVANGDKSFSAAGQRGTKIFKYVLSRFWSCNAVVLIVGFGVVIFGYAIIQAILKTLFGTTLFTDNDIILIFGMSAIFAFNLVMLATILSRAYLIAEGKAPELVAASEAKLSAKTVLTPNIWRQALITFWQVKWIACLTWILCYCVLSASSAYGNSDYAYPFLPVFLIPLSFAAQSKILTGKLGFGARSVSEIKSIWVPYFLCSLLFFAASFVITAITFHFTRLYLGQTWPFTLAITEYTILGSIFFAKFGAILPEIIMQKDRGLNSTGFQSGFSFSMLLRKLWFYNGLTIAGTFLTIGIVGGFLYATSDFIFNTRDHKWIEPFTLFLIVGLFIPNIVMWAVVTTRAYTALDLVQNDAT